MSEEAKQTNIPPDKLVRVTFMPEGKTVEFEFGTMPYDHHGKPMSFLDVAENSTSFSTTPAAASAPAPPATCGSRTRPASAKPTTTRFDRMDMAADQQLNSRLGCQAVITAPGNYVVEIPKWNRNYISEGKPLALAENK